MRNEQKIFLGVIAGVLIGGFYASQSGYENGYREARGEIRSRLQSIGLMSKPPKEVTSVSGTIKSINDQVMTLQVLPAYDPTSSEVVPILYSITVNPETKIMKEVINRTPAKNGEPFYPFIEEDLVGQKIAIGNRVNVSAVSPIKSTSFIAAKVVLTR